MNNCYLKSNVICIIKKTIRTPKILLILFALLNATAIQAQITVTINNPGASTPALAASYPTFAAFTTAINGVNALSATVVVNITGIETAPQAGFTIGSTTLNNATAVSGFGVNIAGVGSTIINAGVGISTPASAIPDGILKIVGADNIVLSNIEFTDGNITNPATMEFGVGIFKASASDGANANRIEGCFFNMQRVNNATGTAPMLNGAVGILLINAIPTAATTALVTASVAGANSNNIITANAIYSGNIGIGLVGYAAPSPYTLADLNNYMEGNSAFYFGGAAGATNPAAGISFNNQYSATIFNNITINKDAAGGVAHPSTLRGIIFSGSSQASADINNNLVDLQGGGTSSLVEGISVSIGGAANANTININTNTIKLGYPTATTGQMNGIITNSTPTTININGNTITQQSISGSTIAIAGTGTMQMINGGGPITLTTSNNIIQNMSRTGVGVALITWRMIVASGPTSWVASGNTIENLSYSSVSSWGTMEAIFSGSATPNVTANNNIIRNLSVPGAVGAATFIHGIRETAGGTGTKLFQNNQVYNFFTPAGGDGHTLNRGIYTGQGNVTVSGNLIHSLNSLGTGVVGGGITGIFLTGLTATTSVFNNKIYNLSLTTANSSVGGITTVGGTNTIYNNLIGDLRMPNSNNDNSVRGIEILTNTVGANIYHNTVFLTGSSTGATWGSSALNAVTTTTNPIIVRNNIFINRSVPSGAGFTVAYRRFDANLATYDNTSNNNYLFSTTNIYTDGTNTDATLAAYKTRVGPTRDAASVTETGIPFISTAGSNAGFLRIAAATTTVAESNAVLITTPLINTDYFGVTRPFPAPVNGGTGPDIGGSEFDGKVGVLPVRLLSFTGTGKAGFNQLNWITANEINNSYFDVERSAEGNIFSSIGRVVGTGNSTSNTSYSFDDKSPVAGSNYYRLKQVDTDGKFQYSAVVHLKNRITIGFYPNPAQDVLNITGFSKNAVFTITNSKGQMVKSGNLSNPSIDIANLAKGVYFLNAEGAAVRFIKQ